MTNKNSNGMRQGGQAAGSGQSPTAASGRERRAYQRYPLTLRAQLGGEGGAVRDAVVRDFCVGGMYLAFDEGTKAAQLYVPKKDQQVSIDCAVPVDGASKSLSFSALVVRGREAGIALRFVNPDLGALQTLLDYAKSLGKNTDDTGKVAPAALNSASFNGKTAAQIIQRCEQMVQFAAGSMVPHFHEDVVDYLFGASKEALNVTEQNAYFEALKVLNNGKDIQHESFLKALEQQLKQYSPAIPPFVETSSDPVSANSLSIVDDEVFDDWLADTATIDSIESRNKEVLTEIERRLSLLYNTEIKRVNNPYGPTLFTRLFHETLKPLELRHKVNLACYKVFRNVLLESLDGLYSKINRYFIDNDVMPVIRYSRSTSPAGKDNHPEKKPAVLAETPQKTESVNPSAESSASALHDITENSHSRDLYQLVGELKTLQQQLGQQLADDAPGKSTNAAKSAKEFFDTAGDPLNLAADNNYSREEVQAALALVKPAIGGVGDKSEIRDFKSEVTKVLGKRAEDENKKIGVRENQIIDVASNMFHWVSEDLQVSEKVRNWIEQLELPMLKIAVNDDALFTDRTHLARQVINKMAQLEMLVGESEKAEQPAVKKALDWVVGLVNEEFDGSTEVFSRAVHQLDVLLNVQSKSYDANLQQLVDGFQQEENDLLGSADADKLLAPVGWDDVGAEEQALWIKRADQPQEGDWLVFSADTEQPERLRIAWKAHKTQRVVFANVLGEKDRVLHLSELAKDLRSGAAMVLQGGDEPIMDRAQYSMLQGLHQQLLHQSTHDQLTGLMSRREFGKLLDDVLSLAKEDKSRHALCFIDLDQFKVINNACGYEGGDQLLKEISALLSEQIKDNWVLARLGSDEFGLLLKNCALDDALDFVEELTEVINDYRLHWQSKRLSIGCSVGLVPISHRSEAASELLQAAESSCGVAKEMGGNRTQLYNESHTGLSQRRKAMKWAVEIDRILDEDTLYLRCQRIMPINAGHGAKDHYEILLGVWDLNGGDISTPEFIEAAERYKRMPDVDRWVIKNSFRWIVEQHQSLSDRIDMFSINLSGRSLNDESFLAFLLEQIRVSQVPVQKITFEVTETTGVANISDAIDFINAVKETGCLFSLDDFGTGMSSYAYLKNLPVDYLKIDGAFVKDMVNNPSDYAVVKSICEIGHFMGKQVIAEFVENDEILALLKELKVDYAQGYGIEKPCHLDDLVKGSSAD
jgi:diguanylate cyclase (GGDEF)-like protein